MGGRGSSSGGGGGKKQAAPLTEERAQSLLTYQNSGHREINKALRKDTGEQKDNIKNIKQMMSSTDKDQMVYRGVNSRISKAMYDDLNGRPGSIMRDKGFMSTTKDPMMARQFASYGTYRMAINLKAGTQTVDMNKTLGKRSIQKGEKEVLVKNGTYLKYIKTDETSKIMYFETI